VVFVNLSLGVYKIEEKKKEKKKSKKNTPSLRKRRNSLKKKIKGWKEGWEHNKFGGRDNTRKRRSRGF